MPTGQINRVIQHVQRALLARGGESLTDGQLIDGFIRRREEAALEILLRRHGPMVLAVCRRILRNHHDAEDAFQATFLVLVRKATSINPREMVANWLYGVACNTALKARAMAAKRRLREKQVAQMPEPEAAKNQIDSDLSAVLDQELKLLPDKYRTTIVLCDLEGKSRKEAAQQLGWPEGTVAGRLARARTLLAKRLARRGLAFSASTLSAALVESAAQACIPTSLTISTLNAICLFATGKAATAGVVSLKVIALTEGVLKAMLVTKLKIATALVVAASIITFQSGVFTYHSTAAEPIQATTDNSPSKPQPSDEILKQQAAKNLDVAEYYRSTGHADTACFYYESIVRRYPKTQFAETAKERLDQLMKAEIDTIEQRVPPRVNDPLYLARFVDSGTVESKVEVTLLEGTWKVVKLIGSEGTTIPNIMRWTFTKNKIVAIQESGKVRQEATYKLGTDKTDKSSVPNAITLTVPLASPAGNDPLLQAQTKTLRGIFALRDGRLTICLRIPGGEGNRPTEIPANPEKDKTLRIFILERETPQKALALDFGFPVKGPAPDSIKPATVDPTILPRTEEKAATDSGPEGLVVVGKHYTFTFASGANTVGQVKEGRVAEKRANGWVKIHFLEHSAVKELWLNLHHVSCIEPN